MELMKGVFVLMISLTLGAAVGIQHSHALGAIWKDCSMPGDNVKINSIKISPEQPKRGQTVSVEATVTILNETMTAGQIAVEAKLDGVPLLRKNYSLCEESSRIQLDCPIKPGENTLKAQPSITDLAPPGNYSITAVITDQSKKEVLCVQANFNL